eukprot:Opistho-1_new@50172
MTPRASTTTSTCSTLRTRMRRSAAPIELEQVGPYRYRLVYQYYNVKWDYAVDTITYKEFRQMIPDDPNDPLGPMITQLSPTALRATYAGLQTFLESQLLPKLAVVPTSNCYNLASTSTDLNAHEWDAAYKKALFCKKEMMAYWYPTLNDPKVKAVLKTFGGDFFVALGRFLPPIIGGLFSTLSKSLMPLAQGLFLNNLPTFVVGAMTVIAPSALPPAMFQYEIVPALLADMGNQGDPAAKARTDLIITSGACGASLPAIPANLGVPACQGELQTVYVGSGIAKTAVACQAAKSKPTQYQFCGLTELGADDLMTNQGCCLTRIRKNRLMLNATVAAGLYNVALSVFAQDPTFDANKFVDVAMRVLFNTGLNAPFTIVPDITEKLSDTAMSLFADPDFDFSGNPQTLNAFNATKRTQFVDTYFTDGYADVPSRFQAATVAFQVIQKAFRAALTDDFKAQVLEDLGGAGPVNWASLTSSPPMPGDYSVPRLFAYHLGTGALTDKTTYPTSMAATGTSINNATYNLGFLADPNVQGMLAQGRNVSRPAGVRYLPFPPNFFKCEFALRNPTFDFTGSGLKKVYSVYRLLLSGNAAKMLPAIGQYWATLQASGGNATIIATARATIIMTYKALTTYGSIPGYQPTDSEVDAFLKMVFQYLYSDLTPILRDWLYSGPGREFGLYMTRPVSDWARGLKSDIYEGATGLTGYCQPGFLTHHTGKTLVRDASHKPLSLDKQGGCIIPSDGGDDALVNQQPSASEYSYYTGKQDISKIWEYAGIGKSTRTVAMSTGEPTWRFVGNWYYPGTAMLPDSPSYLRIQGHSGTQFMPADKTKVLYKYTKPRVTTYNVFVTQANRYLTLLYAGNFDFKGITLNKFVTDRNILKKDDRLNPKFFGKILLDGVYDVYDGLQTTEDSRGFPSWISQPYFLYGDSRLLRQWPNLVTKLAKDGEDAYNTYLGIEPITGATMYARKKLQGNVGVLPGMFSDYNMYNGFVSPTHFWAPIPYYWVNEWADIPDPKADAFKTQIYKTSTGAYVILIALPIIGGLMSILGVFLIVSSRKERLGGTESTARFMKDGGGFEVANPIYSR